MIKASLRVEKSKNTVGSNYHIAGKLGGELNLAVWQFMLLLPN